MSTDREALRTLLRARHPCIAITASDEPAVLEALVGAAVDLNRPVLTWTAVRGITSGMFDEAVDARRDTQQPVKAMRQFANETGSGLFILIDLADSLEDATTARALRELIASCRKLRATVVLVDHQDHLPPAIAREAVRFQPSLPDDQELASLIRETVQRLKVDDPTIAVRLTASDFQALVRNLRGLTRSQAEQVIADAAVQDNVVDSHDLPYVIKRKREVLRGEGLLEQIDATVTLAQIAGIEQLASWLSVRKEALEGAIPGVPPPRGVLLLGVPGSGKSLCAKAIATAWGRPLMRLDAGMLYDKWVGESESRLREALRQAEAMAPMVLWVDEIEKAFASAASHSTDGGLSQRMFGSLLTWMQERTRPVFTIATANDIEALPPELLRKGRFDEIFFLDLPDERVRRDLFRIHLVNRQLDPAAFDLAALARQAEEFSGAEVEHVVATALLESHALKLPLASALVAAIASTTPLAITMQERIERLRQWAALRCRLAGAPPLARASTS